MTAQRETQLSRAASCWEVLDQMRPANAQALIIAELESDESDIMSDYHGSRTVRKVAIGWRTGKREDFKQLRRAAAGYAPTAHLGPNCGNFSVVAIWHGPDHPEFGGRYEGSYVPMFDLHGERFSTRLEALEAILAAGPKHKLDDGEVEYVVEGSTANVEHRDNYSMGHGNWVGIDQYSGWQVRSIDLDYKAYRTDSFVLWLPGLKGMASK